MTASDNTLPAEILGSFFKNLGRISARIGKKVATNVLKNPGLWNLLQTLLPQQQLKVLKQLYQH